MKTIFKADTTNQAPQRPQKRLNKKRARLLILSTGGAVILTAVLTVLFSTVWRRTPEPPPTHSDVEQPTFVYNSQIIPVAQDVNTNPYDPDLFVMADGVMSYKSEDTPAYLGIDVSSFQDKIDWQVVKDAGIEFAMIRVGYRGYTEGKLNLDNRFVYNINEAERVGIPVGIYFYSQATSVEEAREEAKMVLHWISGYNVTYPVVFDWEIPAAEEARTKDVPGDVVTDCAVEFCGILEANGYTPMVYFNQHLAYTYYDLNRVCYFDFWLAEPTGEAPDFYYDFQMYQFTHRGMIPGIPEEVDLNLCFVDYPALAVAGNP